MRTIFYVVLFACVALLARATQATSKGFIFKGEITGYGDGEIIISYSNPNERITPDTIPIINDRFHFEGSLEAPLFVFTKIMNNGKLRQDFFRFDFMLENSVIEFKADVNDLRNYTLTGSVSNAMMIDIREGSRDLMQDVIKVEKSYRSAAEGSQERMQLGDEMEEKVNAYLDYLTSHPNFDSYAGVYLLQLFSSRRVPWQRLETLITRFDDSLHSSPYYSYMERQVDANRRIQTGQKAADFRVSDLDGKSYSLKDFRGDYLLMAFSASWCVPCRYEYPFLEKAYEEYADNGLQVVIINLDDTREKWAGDVKKYNFPFPVLSDLTAFTGNLTKHYGVMSIPKIFLIDPEGNIVSSTIRRQRILDELSEIYK